MADDEQLEEGGDAAAEAFEQVRVAVEQQRGELALMRRAIEGLATERASIDVPDYSETLGHVVHGLDGINGRLDQVTTAIVKSPALAMTPAQVAAQINRAAADLRSADHAALATATDEMKQQGRELRSVVQSALTARDQKDRQLWFGLGGLLIGILLWSFLAQSARSCDFGHLGEHVGNGLVVVDDRPCEERRSAPIRERRYEPWRFEWGSDRLLEPEFFGHRVRDRQSGDGTTGIGGSA